MSNEKRQIRAERVTQAWKNKTKEELAAIK